MASASVIRATHHEEGVSGIDTCDYAERAYKRSSSIADDVTVEVRSYDDIKDVRLAEETVHHAVNELFIHGDASVATRATG